MSRPYAAAEARLPGQPFEPVVALISLYVVENNGVRFLAAMLRAHGYAVVEIYLKDYLHHRFVPPTEREIALVLQILQERRVNLVGISLRAGGYLPVCRDLTRRIHERLDLPVMWGGMHVTMNPEQCMPDADLLMLGECEHALVDLLDRLRTGRDIADVANLWLRRGDSVIRNPPRPLEESLDALPFRDFHSSADKYHVEGERFTRGDPYADQTCYLMLSARGCLYNCSFCDISALRRFYRGKGLFYRAMSPEKVVEECRYALRTFKNLRRFRFDDELFMLADDWVDTFCTLYATQVALPFEILTDPRAVRREPLAKLKAAGLTTVMMGIQNVERVNRALYHRDVADEKVLEAARLLHDLGLHACYQVIVDDPVSTPRDKRDLFDLLARLPRSYDLYLFSLAYWPATDLTETLLQAGTITPEQVEGNADKCLHQFRADMTWPRPPEDVFWLSLYTLLSKNIVPVGVLRALSHSRFLMRHPGPLRVLSEVCNFFKLAGLALRMLRDRELTFAVVRRWLNVRSMPSA